MGSFTGEKMIVTVGGLSECGKLTQVSGAAIETRVHGGRMLLVHLHHMGAALADVGLSYLFHVV